MKHLSFIVCRAGARPRGPRSSPHPTSAGLPSDLLGIGPRCAQFQKQKVELIQAYTIKSTMMTRFPQQTQIRSRAIRYSRATVTEHTLHPAGGGGRGRRARQRGVHAHPRELGALRALRRPPRRAHVRTTRMCDSGFHRTCCFSPYLDAVSSSVLFSVRAMRLGPETYQTTAGV